MQSTMRSLLLLLAACSLHGRVYATAADICESVDGVLDCTLRVEAKRIHLNFKGISFQTRAYNGKVPGPVMRAKPGDHVRIRLQNSLGGNTNVLGCHAPLAEYRAPNSTNIHIHGIYDSSSADNTFVCVHPGNEYVYNYQLDPRSGTSTLWYHPHMDGSTSAQLYGGMAGAFEIIDQEQEKLFSFASTHVLVLQMLDLDPASKDFLVAYMSNGGAEGGSALSPDLHNPEDYKGKLILTNGEVNPGVSLSAGEYMRLKLINAMSGGTNNVNIGFQGMSADSCRIHVLAYDGVYLSAPREQRSLFLPSGGKADIAVLCSTPGNHALLNIPTGVEAFGGTILDTLPVLALNVKTSTGTHGSLPRTLPGPPAYYPDLSNTKPDMYHEILMSDPNGGNNVHGTPYSRHSVSYTMPHGSVQEWTIGALEGTAFLKIHSYHQHFTHFQIMQSSLKNEVIVGQPGDYRDTVVVYRDLNYTIRFIAPFEGLMMIHCHVLKHEDLGMMTLANITMTPTSLMFTSAAPWARQLRVAFAVTMTFAFALLASSCFVFIRLRRNGVCGSCYHECPEDNNAATSRHVSTSVGRPQIQIV